MNKKVLLFSGASLCLLVASCGGDVGGGSGINFNQHSITELEYNGLTKTLKWKSDGYQTKYDISVNGLTETVTSSNRLNTYKFDAEGGDLEVSIKNYYANNKTEEISAYIVKLDYVTDARIVDGVVIWSDIKGAEGYEIDGKRITTTQYELGAGAFNLYPVPYGNYDEHMSKLYYLYGEKPANLTGKKLEAPKNFKFDDDENLSWDSVVGANGYLLDIGGFEERVDTNKFNMSGYTENQQVSIKTLGNGSNIIDSNYTEPRTIYFFQPISNYQVVDGVLHWDKVEGAEGYKIQIDGVTQRDMLTENEYKNIQPGSAHVYKIKPYVRNELAHSPWSTEIPINILRSPVLTFGSNQLQWNQVAGASGYQIRIKYEATGQVDEFECGENERSYDFNFALPGKYEATITAITSDNGNGVYNSKPSTPLNITKLEAPSGINFSNDPTQTNDLRINVNAVPNANGYQLLLNGQEANIGVSQSPSFNFSVSQLYDGSEEVELNFAVKALGKINNQYVYLTSEQSDTLVVTRLAAPRNVSINNGLISWDPVAKANGYIVRVDGAIAHQGNDTFFTLQTVSQGTHEITIQARGDGKTTIASKFSSPLVVNKLAKPVTSIHRDDTNKHIFVDWQEIASAQSYLIKIGNEEVGETHASTFDVTNFVDRFATNTGTLIMVTAKGDGHEILDSDSSEPITAYRFSAPENIRLAVNNVIWDSCKYGNAVASDYTVEIDGERKEIVTGTVYPISKLSAGTHVLKIKANGVVTNTTPTIDSDWSKEFRFTKLPEVSGIVRSGREISWSAVNGATNYEVKFSNESTARTIDNATKVEVPFTSAGTYTCDITAMGDNTTIASSDVHQEEIVAVALYKPQLTAEEGELGETSFRVTYEGNIIKIECGANPLATGYNFIVSGVDHKTDANTRTYQFQANAGIEYTIRVKVLARQFNDDGTIFYVDSQESDVVRFKIPLPDAND